jgi:hypothetical protein
MAGGKARLPPRWFVVTAWHVHRRIRSSKWVGEDGSQGPDFPAAPWSGAGCAAAAPEAGRRWKITGSSAR